MTNNTVETQKELCAPRQGNMKMYQTLIVGSGKFSRLLIYESIMFFSSRTPGALGLWLRAKLYPLLLGRAGKNVTFGQGVVLRHPHKIMIGDNVVIDDYCVLDAKGSDNEGIKIGNGVFLGRNTILNCKNGDIILEDNVNIGFNSMIFSASRVTVERDTLLAAYCYLVGGTHNYENPDVPVLEQGRQSTGILMKAGGWLGAHATVLDGVTIGKHVVISAGSVVHKNIPDYATAGGAPVMILQRRKKGDNRS